MPRLRPDQLPRLRRRKDGTAVVTLSGEDVYLGPFGDDPGSPRPEAVSRYRRAVAEWERRGRRTRPPTPTTPTVGLLCERYAAWVLTSYRKRGGPTSGARRLARAARRLAETHADCPAGEFTADDLRGLRDGWVRSGLNRETVNRAVRETVGIFRWGRNDASPPLVPVGVVAALRELSPLRRGRSPAPEPEEVDPADPVHVEAVLAVASPWVAGLIRLQLLTGMRPCEACALEAAHLDRSRPTWVYRVPDEANKMAHRGRRRVVALSAAARDLLTPWLLRRPEGPLLSHRAGVAYSADAYRRQVDRLCRRAEVPVWGPNRLRHSFATEVRGRLGLEAVQAALGHARADVSERYAKQAEDAAVRVVEALDGGA